MRGKGGLVVDEGRVEEGPLTEEDKGCDGEDEDEDDARSLEDPWWFLLVVVLLWLGWLGGRTGGLLPCHGRPPAQTAREALSAGELCG